MAREQHPNLVATAALINDHVTMFESTRRKVLRHIGWDKPFVTLGMATRTQGNFWCILVSDCLRCNGGFTALPRSSYLMWRSYLPVQCDHSKTITDIYVSPGGKEPGDGGQVIMPQVVRFVKHPAASVSSGGVVNSAKLTADLDKVNTRGNEALVHLRAYSAECAHSPAPQFFPELQREYILTQISLVEERIEDLQAALEDQIVAKRQQESDFPPPTPPVVENGNPNQHSTPQPVPRDEGGLPLLPPRPPEAQALAEPADRREQEFHTPREGGGDQVGGSQQAPQGGEQELSAGLQGGQAPAGGGAGDVQEGAQGNQDQVHGANGGARPREPRVEGVRTTGAGNDTGISNYLENVVLDGHTVNNGTNQGENVGNTTFFNNALQSAEELATRRQRDLATALQQVNPSSAAPNTVQRVGTPSYTTGFLYNHLSRNARQGPVLGNNQVRGDGSMHARKESSIAESRRALMDGKVNAWERELDSLELAISKVREKPTLEGVKFLRERKSELGKKTITAQSLLEDVLSASTDNVQLVATRAHGAAQQSGLERRLDSMEEAIGDCERKALEDDINRENQRPQGGNLVERLSLPKFSGDQLHYVEFKNLFNELTQPLKLSEPAALEYLKRSLDGSLQYIIRGSKERREAWARLDEHFADRVGQIRLIMKNLSNLDLSKGKMYQKVEKLCNEIRQAEYLLKELKAGDRLKGDIELVGSIIKKLPQEARRDWVDWSSSQEEEVIPGESEWPVFLKWLAKVRKAALRDRWYDDGETKPSSSAGEKTTAKARSLDYVNVGETEVNLVGSKGDAYKKAFEAEARIRGPCPDCKEVHVWERNRRGGDKWPSDQFRNCPLFLAMTPKQKAERLEKAGGCPKCTSWRHSAKDCRNPRTTICKVPVGSGVCDKPHNDLLHDSGSAYCDSNAVINVSITERGEIVLLGMQEIKVQAKRGRQEGILFYDSGSTLTLCRHEWAVKAGYKGTPISIFLKVLAQGYEQVDTMQYELELIDVNGNIKKVLAVGLDSLTQEAPGGDLRHAYEKFPDIDRKAIERPEGVVDILLGQDYAGFLPRVERTEGHLLLLRSQFGSGLLLSGRTDQEGGVVCEHLLTDKATEYSRGKRKLPAAAVVVNYIQDRLPSFMEAEELACAPMPACQEHRESLNNCRECRYRGEKVSKAERSALQRMEDSLIRRPDGKLQIQYPFNEKALRQRDNKFQARQVQERVEENVA